MSTKRAVQLASKLQNEENARLRLQVFTWVEESKSWAKDMMAKYGPNEAQKDEAGFRDERGNLIQEGVEYSAESLAAFLEEAEKCHEPRS